MPAYLKNRLLVLLVMIFLQTGVSILEPGSTRLVETDFDFCFSDKYVGKIYPRSSISVQFVLVGAGMADSGNIDRGNIRMILDNFSQKELNLTQEII